MTGGNAPRAQSQNPHKPKVLHIISDPNIGGAGILLIHTVMQMRGDYDISVALPHDGQLVPRLHSVDIATHPIRGHVGKSFSVRSFRDISRLLRRLRPDIVHTHASLSGRVAAWRHGIKNVYTRHCAFAPRPASTRPPLKQLAGLINNTISDAAIASGPIVRSHLIAQGTQPARIRLIKNGIPPVAALDAPEKAAVRQKYNIPADAFVVCLAARLSPGKGHDTALAIAKILAADAQIMLLLAGTGPMHDEIAQRLQTEGIHNAVMLGFVTEIHEIHNICDCFINTSTLSEATSLAILEPLSLGKPGVVSDVGGNPDVVRHEHSGFVVQKNDPQAFADAIIMLKSNADLYAKMSASAAWAFRAEYTCEAMGSKISALYTDILRHKGDLT